MNENDIKKLEELSRVLEIISAVELVKYIRKHKVEYIFALDKVSREYEEQSCNSQYEYNRGYNDALALLEKENKIVIVNNYVTPFA